MTLFVIDLFIQLPELKENDIISIINNSISNDLITRQDVSNYLCQQKVYLRPFSSDEEYFDFLYTQNQFDEALKILFQFKELEIFAERAVRLFHYRPIEVIQLLIQRHKTDQNDIYSKYLIPIFLSQQFFEHSVKTSELICQTDIDTYWLLYVFANWLNMSDSRIIQLFFKSSEICPTPHAKEYAIRNLSQQKAYQVVYQAFKLMGKIKEAALVVAIEDPTEALKIILSISDEQQKHECAIQVLKSLNKIDSQNLACQMLNVIQEINMDLETFLPFLPGDTVVKNLTSSIDNFIQTNNETITKRNSVIESTKSGIQYINNQISQIPDFSLELPSSATCYICNESLFDAKSFLFKCYHFFHESCYLQLFNHYDPETYSDCPFCGLSSALLIDQDFPPGEI